MSRRRRHRGQLELPLDRMLLPPAGPESDCVYSAVMYLRSSGFDVYRSGARSHLVRGRQISTMALCKLGGTAGSQIYR